MKQLFITLIIACISNHATAQDKICLPAGTTPNSIAFNDAAVNQYLGFEKYKAVFYGEQHNSNFDPEIKYHLITDLHRHYGFRHVFMEIGFSESYLYNRYLRTGDTTLLSHPRLIFTSFYYLQFWNRLYMYNKSLPDDKKIIIHGIDFERTDVYKTVSLLAPAGKPVPEPLKPVMDTIAAHLGDNPLRMYAEKDGKLYGLVDNAPFKKRLKYIQSEFLTYAAISQDFFGSNYAILESIIHNKSEVTVRPKPRNKTMFENMKQTIASEKTDKFIVFLGGSHLQYRQSSSLVNRVKDLPGLDARNMLNIVEAVYNIKALRENKDADRLKTMNDGCRATIFPATVVPGYETWADFVIIADNQE